MIRIHIPALPDDDPRKAAIDAAVDAQMQSEAVQAQIEKITEEKYKAASQGAGQIQALKASLTNTTSFIPASTITPPAYPRRKQAPQSSQAGRRS